jgi:pyridoxal phosphate enzyme (YggS family)
MNVLDNLKFINKRVKNLCASNNYTEPTIIVVSKTFDINYILPIINYGHKHFGENKVQESKLKWTSIIKKDFGIKLHMVGSLQSNKAAEAVNIFNYIHSLDNEKLANTLAKLEIQSQKKINYFIQVNIGQEKQKNGVEISIVKEFSNYCISDLKLNVLGLMCIPPLNNKTLFYFDKLKNLNDQLNFKNLSMGMSNDFKLAIQCGANYVRVGSAIFNFKN